MSKQRPSFTLFKERALKDKEFKKEYELLGPEFELLEELLIADALGYKVEFSLSPKNQR